MKKCEKYTDIIEKLISGEITSGESELLNEHIKNCNDCVQLVNMHNELVQLDSALEQPDAEDLNLMRHEVLRSLRSEQDNALHVKWAKFINYLQSFLRRPELAFAAVALIIGIFLGRALPPDENGIAGGIVKQISKIANQNIRLSDTQNSEYQFSNVSMEQLEDETIELSFDVSTHLDLVRHKNDPLVKEVIAQTLMNPENVGTGLRAVTYSESILDDKIKNALIFTVQNAPLLSVRLKAMDGLLKYKNDPLITEAFVDLLQKEQSMKMNLMAVDYLTESNVNKDTLKSVLSEIDPKRSTAIFVRAKKYLEKE